MASINRKLGASFLLAVAATHAGIVLVVLLFMSLLDVGKQDLAFVIAAISGSYMGAWLFRRAGADAAPFAVKVTIGVVMAICVVVESVLAGSIRGWVTYPEVVIPIDAVGTLVFPFVIFGTFERALAQGKARNRKGV